MTLHIAIIGTGYVGLVTGACFAEMGNHVTCVDVDQSKIDNLKKGILPIYEPGLDPLVSTNHKNGLIHFTTDLSEAMKSSDIFFIAVGTPPRKTARPIFNTYWLSPEKSVSTSRVTGSSWTNQRFP